MAGFGGGLASRLNAAQPVQGSLPGMNFATPAPQTGGLVKQKRTVEFSNNTATNLPGFSQPAVPVQGNTFPGSNIGTMPNNPTLSAFSQQPQQIQQNMMFGNSTQVQAGNSFPALNVTNSFFGLNQPIQQGTINNNQVHKQNQLLEAQSFYKINSAPLNALGLPTNEQPPQINNSLTGSSLMSNINGFPQENNILQNQLGNVPNQNGNTFNENGVLHAPIQNTGLNHFQSNSVVNTIENSTNNTQTKVSWGLNNETTIKNVSSSNSMTHPGYNNLWSQVSTNDIDSRISQAAVALVMDMRESDISLNIRQLNDSDFSQGVIVDNSYTGRDFGDIDKEVVLGLPRVSREFIKSEKFELTKNLGELQYLKPPSSWSVETSVLPPLITIT